MFSIFFFTLYIQIYILNQILFFLLFTYFLGVKITIQNYIPHPSMNALPSSPDSDETLGTIHSSESTNSMVIFRLNGSNWKNSGIAKDTEMERNKRRDLRDEKYNRYGRDERDKEERKERNGLCDDSTVQSEGTQVHYIIS